MIVPRDITMLRTIGTAGYATVGRVRTDAMPTTSGDNRVARKRLGDLLGMGLVAKASQLVVRPDDGQPARVWFLTKKGAEVLAVELGDAAWLSCAPPAPNPMTLRHTVLCGEFRVMLEQAAEKCPDLRITRFLFEWSQANPHAKEPQDRYTLFTVLREKPKLVCKPDFAFQMDYLGRKKVFFGEMDRETSGINAIAASKTPGYAEMLKQKAHKRLYPETTFDTFSVLHVSLRTTRRDALVKAIAPKDGAELWRFMAWSEITAETLLFGNLVYDCRKDPPEKQKPQPYPLISRPEAAVRGEDMAVARG